MVSAKFEKNPQSSKADLLYNTENQRLVAQEKLQTWLPMETICNCYGQKWL